MLINEYIAYTSPFIRYEWPAEIHSNENSPTIDGHSYLLNEEATFSDKWSSFAQRVVRIANEEWVKWGRGTHFERDNRRLPELINYAKTVTKEKDPDKALEKATRMAKGYARDAKGYYWSAAFVSYVMQQAGAGDKFNYSALHWDYVNEAKLNTKNERKSNPFWLYDLNEKKPEVGDIICAYRNKKMPMSYSNIELAEGTQKWMHCDIVVSVDEHTISVIGGNTCQGKCADGDGTETVGKKQLRLTPDGFVERQKGVIALLKIRKNLSGKRSLDDAPDVRMSISREVEQNRKWSVRLGWEDYRRSINDLLGFDNMSPTEQAFADTVKDWQRANGFQGREVDGVIGPNTWRKMKPMLQALSAGDRSSTSASQISSGTIHQNNAYAEILGWDEHRYKIYTLLGFVDMSPTAAAFAEAVADWQRSNGFIGNNVDGVIGPQTWHKMRSSLGMASPQGGNTSSARIPLGFSEVRGKGLSRYNKQRLDQRLRSIRAKGLLDISDRDIDTLQRISNIEVSGGINGINTWDGAVVSLGFMQFTLQHGKLQEWITMAPDDFKRYGIALDHGSPEYKWIRNGVVKNRATAIKGARNKNSLRFGLWAQRFFDAGEDERIIAAGTRLALQYLQRHLKGLNRRLKKMGQSPSTYQTFKTYYDRSPYVRGMFQASYNNLPAASAHAVRIAIFYFNRSHHKSVASFEEAMKKGVVQGYARFKWAKERGPRMVRKTMLGSMKKSLVEKELEISQY